MGRCSRSKASCFGRHSVKRSRLQTRPGMRSKPKAHKAGGDHGRAMTRQARRCWPWLRVRGAGDGEADGAGRSDSPGLRGVGMRLDEEQRHYLTQGLAYREKAIGNHGAPPGGHLTLALAWWAAYWRREAKRADMRRYAPDQLHFPLEESEEAP